MSWFSGLEDICQPDVPLAPHTWYGLGGPARWLLTPRDEPQLAEVLARCARHGIPWRVLGRGANILVRDEGVDAAVIRLRGAAWETITLAPPLARAGGGADFPRLVKLTAEQGLAGLAGLAGIPGTIGGAVRMNAGGRYGCIADCLRDVRLLWPDGRTEVRPAADLGLGYRASRLDGGIITSATFALTPGDPAALTARFQQVWREKHATQPALAARSAGCIFRNPPGHAAGALIDRAGLKGARRGQAEISPRHANFILAHPGATARDVLDLIELARERIAQTTGIRLELEVEIW